MVRKKRSKLWQRRQRRLWMEERSGRLDEGAQP